MDICLFHDSSCKRNMKYSDAQGRSCTFTLQDGGVEGLALISSCENTKISIDCWIAIDRGLLKPTEKSCKDGRGKITIKSNPISTRWVTQKLDNNNTKEVLALLWRFYAPHQSSQPVGSSKKTGNLTWRTVGFDYRTSTELEETEGTNKILCTSRSNEESSDPTRDWDRLDCECLRVFCGSVGQKWPAAGEGALAAAVLGGTYWHKSFLEVTNSPTIEPVDSRTEFTNSKQQTGLEHSPTHQQIIRLKIYWAWPCPTKQDSVLPTVSPSSEILPKPLILIQQSVDRRSKNCNPTAYRTKISIAEI